MENTRTLDQLAAGQRATVAAITAPEDRRRRLLELGLFRYLVTIRRAGGGRRYEVEELR